MMRSFVVFSLLSTAFAANDWSKPCLSGVCFYDLPPSVAASGTLKIWGAPDSITDITTAAGWEIIDCNKDRLSQDIRLVCTGDANCEHLYQNIGAVGKIVRLPENCGSNAFAHISRAWISEDQSIPEDISKRLVRRNGLEPEVKALHLDTNFGAVDVTKVGIVNFALTGANIPGAQDIVPFPPTKSKRQLFSQARNFVRDAVDAVTGLNDVKVDESVTLQPLEINDRFNIIDQTLSCPPLEASLKVDVDAKASAIATIGVAAQGTIVPPKIDDFAVTATLSGEVDGAINIAAGISGSIDSGAIPLFEIGIPGLDFPGILTIGPTFSVEAQAIATLELTADINVGVNYKIDKARVVFPPDRGSSQTQDNAFAIGDTPLKLTVAPTVSATGTIEAHLIPSLNLGISALGDLVEAKVFLELDASAGLSLSLEASAEVSGSANTTPMQPKQQMPETAGHDGSAASPVDVMEIRGAGAMGRHYFARQAIETDTALGGCFEITAGLDVNVGADADFFGLFDAGTSVSLFSADFELFKQCFGETASQPQQLAEPNFDVGLTCPISSAGTLQTIVDQLIPARSVKTRN